MRLLRLRLPKFKNLEAFEISFDSSSPISVLVGRNGTGKSNILEALTIIFRDLDLGISTVFEYEMDYICRERHVQLSHDPSGEIVKCLIDGLEFPFAHVQGESGRELRPDYVFGYYSGPSNRLEDHFALHQERFYRELIKGNDRPLRPLFYARNVHSNFVLLSFFLEDEAEVRRFLSEQLGIVNFDSVLFVMQKPSWHSRKGDPRFWNARGTVRDFLDLLYRLALSPLRLESRVPTGLSRTMKTERLFLYLPDLRTVRELRAAYESTQEFFKALESTYISELMNDVRIRVLVKRAETPLTFRELSEGEQQLLLVLGLMRFTKEEESLFLLDEPDTHLNPAWSVQYKKFLMNFGGLDDQSHIVLATHDPLLVASMNRDQVRILSPGPDGAISAEEPWEDPQGMGIGALLTSDVYGLRSQLDLETLATLDRKRELVARSDELSDQEVVELRQLRQELERLDLVAEDRDPEFQDYLLQKFARERLGRTPIVLSKEQIAEQRVLTREILEEQEAARSDEGEYDSDPP